jgi:hypothetical protein
LGLYPPRHHYVCLKSYIWYQGVKHWHSSFKSSFRYWHSSSIISRNLQFIYKEKHYKWIPPLSNYSTVENGHGNLSEKFYCSIKITSNYVFVTISFAASTFTLCYKTNQLSVVFQICLVLKSFTNPGLLNQESSPGICLDKLNI